MIRSLLVSGLVPILSAAVAWAQPPAKPLALPDGVTYESLADPKAAAKVADKILEQYPTSPRPEAVEMLVAILRGSQLDGSDGWFHPSLNRYGWAWLIAHCGLDPKTDSIALNQFTGPESLFKQLDRDGDGKLTASDLDWSDRSSYVMQAGMLGRLFRRMDGNGNGKLTKDEFDKVFQMLSQGKDHITADDFRQRMIPRGPMGMPAGDKPTIPMLVKGLFGEEIGSKSEGPKLNDAAPDFKLKTADGKDEVQLTKLFGSKPTVLVFGNFTCGPFRSLYPDVEAVFGRFKDQANFVMVYVREAHPTDGWKMDSNARFGVKVSQPQTYAERVGVCEQFRTMMQPGMNCLVDDITDPAGQAYSAMPARLYVIDAKGKVAYKSGRGPFGFKPGEMEQALLMSLVEHAPKKVISHAPFPSNEATWAKLPKATEGQGAALPNWAKAVSIHLPRTAAAMLELDYAHRTKSPVDPALRAKMRWVIAKANRCDYTQKTALADLKRVAGDDAVARLTDDSGRWAAEDREPLEFARLLTVAAPTITDELFASLQKRFGDHVVASMVLLAAYGNFQDRLVLGLGLPLETDGPMAPLNVRFADGSFQVAPIIPPQKDLPKLLTSGMTVVSPQAEWSATSYADLQSRLESQRSRKPRLPVPTWDEVKGKLPPQAAAKPTKIVWSLVCNGYVPELAVPWNITTRTMWAESMQDRVFEESLFWIQTRAIGCNYCMGHCEMLLEVAGLDSQAVAERTKRLASDDWSCFPPAEQRAYAYARKLSKTPWELTATDYQTLVADQGADKAMFTFWWLCRGLYMTRISDGFQLPLERDNVFGEPAKK